MISYNPWFTLGWYGFSYDLRWFPWNTQGKPTKGGENKWFSYENQWIFHTYGRLLEGNSSYGLAWGKTYRKPGFFTIIREFPDHPIQVLGSFQTWCLGYVLLFYNLRCSRRTLCGWQWVIDLSDLSCPHCVSTLSNEKLATLLGFCTSLEGVSAAESLHLISSDANNKSQKMHWKGSRSPSTCSLQTRTKSRTIWHQSPQQSAQQEQLFLCEPNVEIPRDILNLNRQSSHSKQ